LGNAVGSVAAAFFERQDRAFQRIPVDMMSPLTFMRPFMLPMSWAHFGFGVTDFGLGVGLRPGMTLISTVVQNC
jgi:hypothetical protein